MQGLVNDQFEHLMISKRAQNPQFVVQTLEDYCAEIEAMISQMKNDMQYLLFKLESHISILLSKNQIY